MATSCLGTAVTCAWGEGTEGTLPGDKGLGGPLADSQPGLGSGPCWGWRHCHPLSRGSSAKKDPGVHVGTVATGSSSSSGNIPLWSPHWGGQECPKSGTSLGPAENRARLACHLLLPTRHQNNSFPVLPSIPADCTLFPSSPRVPADHASKHHHHLPVSPVPTVPASP